MPQIIEQPNVTSRFIYDSPVGPYEIELDDSVLSSVSMVKGSSKVEAHARASSQDIKAASRLLDQFFTSGKVLDALPEVEGTAFQKRVWAELIKIPAGQTRTYGEIAKAVNNPGASRAIGMACNRNPVSLLIPCHRVVSASGIGGYASGLARKKWLLNHEMAFSLQSLQSVQPHCP